MASPPHPVVTFSLLILSLLFSTACSATCAAPKLKHSNLYKNCNELPTLKSTLHWTYTAANKTLAVAFTAAPPADGGWVAWGINPTGTGMGGTQAILAYKDPNGSMAVKTYNISSYSSIVEGKLAFQVYDKRAEFNAGDGSITIFAVVESAGGKVNQIWQVGPGVSKGVPEKHEFNQENLNSKASLDLSSVAPTGASQTSGDAGLRKRNVGFVLLLGLVFAVFCLPGRS